MGFRLMRSLACPAESKRRLISDPHPDSSRQSAREAPKKEPGLELIVFPHSIRIRNDSLYFRYGLRNHTDTSFTVYNLGYIGYIWLAIFQLSTKHGVILLLYDQKHQIRFNAAGIGAFGSETRPDLLPLKNTDTPITSTNTSCCLQVKPSNTTGRNIWGISIWRKAPIRSNCGMWFPLRQTTNTTPSTATKRRGGKIPG